MVDCGQSERGFPTILIVDDREENLIALEALLESCEAKVTRASSGNEALALMLENEFALVLLDVQMPEMDGFEVAELMRLNAKTRYLPIIYLTAINKEDRHIFKGYEMGAVDYLQKPIEPIILKCKVNIFLDLWRQRQELTRALADKDELTLKLKIQAESDSLTGLPNRTLFLDRLQQATLMSERTVSTGVLMFIDLDNFKWVNDTLGHETGDALLIQVSERLLECVRKTDTVARLGGDEFTIILPDIKSEADATRITSSILESLATPFKLNEKVVHVSGSIGLTVFPSDDSSVENLLRNADMAMYQAKEAGRNTFRRFTPEMNLNAYKRLLLEEPLRAALDRDEFVLHYQPRVDIRTGRINGVEALVRWQKEDEKIIPPDRFISMAEEIGLIIPLGKWVLETACRQCQEWVAAGNDMLKVSVNISAVQFSNKEELMNAVTGALQQSGLAPHNLEIEITESTVMKNIDSARGALEELHATGIDISIDDFGTGYSSLSSLKQFPIQALKIDKSFIQDLVEDQDDCAIVSAIISMAHKLSLSVVAEGVETREQLNFLREEGGDEIQGYYFSRPVPADDITQMLAENRTMETL